MSARAIIVAGITAAGGIAGTEATTITTGMAAIGTSVGIAAATGAIAREIARAGALAPKRSGSRVFPLAFGADAGRSNQKATTGQLTRRPAGIFFVRRLRMPARPFQAEAGFEGGIRW